MKRQKDKAVQDKGIRVLQAARAVTAIAFLVMVSLLGYHLYEYRQGDQIYDRIREEAGGREEAGQTEDSASPEGGTDGTPIDFDALRAINPDCIAWISGCDGGIDYPVVLSEDDTYYLSHTIDGEENKAGSIFVDQYAEEPFEQFQTILYGHNMKNGSMFHSLLNYREQAYWENHQTITVYLEGETKEYQIFAVYYRNNAALPVYDSVETWAQRQDYLDTALAMSLYDTEVEVNADDRLLTLITCEYSGEDYRMVVCAVERENLYELPKDLEEN